MKLLLDNHTFLCWDSNPDRIPARTIALIQQSSNQVLLSLVTPWEIQIKTQLGKLSLQAPLSNIIRQQTENGISILPITLPHILELDELPLHHKDPFDRLLIAQSRVEKATLVSCDSILEKYDCQVLW
jgi:PIN domain nuclease of toxin-antitoxin system